MTLTTSASSPPAMKQRPDKLVATGQSKSCGASPSAMGAQRANCSTDVRTGFQDNISISKNYKEYRQFFLDVRQVQLRAG